MRGLGNGSGDVVYSWTAPDSGTFTFELIDSRYDTVLYVRDSACGDEFAVNDDYYGLRSGLTVDVASGTTYTVIIDGYGYGDSGYPEEGDYVLSIYEGDALVDSGYFGGDSGVFSPEDVAGAAVPLLVGIGLTLVIMGAGRREEEGET